MLASQQIAVMFHFMTRGDETHKNDFWVIYKDVT